MKSRNLLILGITLITLCIIGISLLLGALGIAKNAAEQIARTYSPEPDFMALVPFEALTASPYLIIGGCLTMIGGSGLVRLAIKFVDKKNSSS